MQDIIVIVGPTGVGKTKLSLELAKKFDAEIINGDSVAIYRDLDIGSAKPTKDEQRQVVHHLIDICDVCEDYSVFDYQRDVRKQIDEISSRGKRIIIVGGTGLYIKAALYDYRFSEKKEEFSYSNLTNEEIFQRIQDYSLDLSLPHIHNRRRLVRLLNKLENHEEITNYKDKLLYPVFVIGLTTDREILYQRINQRVDDMFRNGLLKEVNRLRNQYFCSRILNHAIGYQEFLPYFQGKKNLEEVKEDIKLHSRRFAKRQYTFFQHQFSTHWFNVCLCDFSKTVEEVAIYLKTHGYR